jgi:hypothetical protein
MPRLAAIRRFDRPSALSRRTSRIFRIGNLSWDIPLAPSVERERGPCRFEDHPTGQRHLCTIFTPRTPWSGIAGRHQSERGVDVICRTRRSSSTGTRNPDDSVRSPAATINATAMTRGSITRVMQTLPPPAFLARRIEILRRGHRRWRVPHYRQDRSRPEPRSC